MTNLVTATSKKLDDNTAEISFMATGDAAYLLLKGNPIVINIENDIEAQTGDSALVTIPNQFGKVRADICIAKTIAASYSKNKTVRQITVRM